MEICLVSVYPFLFIYLYLLSSALPKFSNVLHDEDDLKLNLEWNTAILKNVNTRLISGIYIDIVEQKDLSCIPNHLYPNCL